MWSSKYDVSVFATAYTWTKKITFWVMVDSYQSWWSGSANVSVHCPRPQGFDFIGSDKKHDFSVFFRRLSIFHCLLHVPTRAAHHRASIRSANKTDKNMILCSFIVFIELSFFLLFFWLFFQQKTNSLYFFNFQHFRCFITVTIIVWSLTKWRASKH